MSEFRYFTSQLYQSGSTPNPVIAEIPFTNVAFDAQLNSIGTFTGEVLLSGLDFVSNSSGLLTDKMNIFNGTQPGQTILWIDYNGVLIWSGVIWQREWDTSTQILKITGQEMLSYFKRRKITDTLSFPSSSLISNSSDPVLIANYLMTYYAQGKDSSFPKTHGNIGLLAESSPATDHLSITREYFDFELKEIYQAVKDLSDGLDSNTTDPYFDFVIKPSYNSNNLPVNTLHFMIPNDSSNTVALQFPGNLVEYSYTEDGSSMVNTLFGLGYGSNALKTIAVATDDASVYPTYWGSISSYGNGALLEDSASFIDIQNLGLLETSTLGQLNALSHAPTTIQAVIAPYVDPYLGTFNLGDDANILIIDDMFPNGFPYTSAGSVFPGIYNALWRVVAISVQPGEDKESRVTITLSQPYVNFGNVTQKTVTG